MQQLSNSGAGPPGGHRVTVGGVSMTRGVKVEVKVYKIIIYMLVL